MEPREGDQFGNYKLKRPLGGGGFANVWLGEHDLAGRLAAIKILKYRVTDDEERKSFLQEARNTAHLSHPNIVRLLECDIENDVPFLVLEYAPNGTLRTRHPRGTPVPLSTIVPYVEQIAAGLQHAHDRRLIHRDVKPENLLLGPNDEIWLSDFGISMVAQSRRYSQPPPNEVMGTLNYMAPEQFNDTPVAASDQYALAVVVYEWLSGKLPFSGATPPQIQVQQQTVRPTLQDKVPGLPAEVEHVVAKALSYRPQDRFRNVQEFAQQLAQAAQQGAGLIQPDQTGRSSQPDSLAWPTNSGLADPSIPLVNSLQQPIPPNPLIQPMPALSVPPEKPGVKTPKNEQGNFPEAILPLGVPLPPSDNTPTDHAQPPQQPPAPYAGGTDQVGNAPPPFNWWNGPPPGAQPAKSINIVETEREPRPNLPPTPSQAQTTTTTQRQQFQTGGRPRRRPLDWGQLRQSKNYPFMLLIIFDLIWSIFIYLGLKDGNIGILSFLVLASLRMLCVATIRRWIAQICAVLIALGWAVGSAGLLTVIHQSQLWAATLLVLIPALAIHLSYALRKPRYKR